MRKRMKKIEVMKKIVSERSPCKLHVIRCYAVCYVEWKESDKHEMYKFIRENFKVDVDGIVSL